MEGQSTYHRRLSSLREDLRKLERKFQTRRRILESRISVLETFLSSAPESITKECTDDLEKKLAFAGQDDRTRLWERVAKWREGNFSEFTVREAIDAMATRGLHLGKNGHQLMGQALKAKMTVFQKTQDGFALRAAANKLTQSLNINDPKHWTQAAIDEATHREE